MQAFDELTVQPLQLAALRGGEHPRTLPLLDGSQVFLRALLDFVPPALKLPVEHLLYRRGVRRVPAVGPRLGELEPAPGAPRGYLCLEQIGLVDADRAFPFRHDLRDLLQRHVVGLKQHLRDIGTRRHHLFEQALALNHVRLLIHSRLPGTSHPSLPGQPYHRSAGGHHHSHGLVQLFFMVFTVRRTVGGWDNLYMRECFIEVLLTYRWRPP